MESRRRQFYDKLQAQVQKALNKGYSKALTWEHSITPSVRASWLWTRFCQSAVYSDPSRAYWTLKALPDTERSLKCFCTHIELIQQAHPAISYWEVIWTLIVFLTWSSWIGYEHIHICFKACRICWNGWNGTHGIVIPCAENFGGRDPKVIANPEKTSLKQEITKPYNWWQALEHWAFYGAEAEIRLCKVPSL